MTPIILQMITLFVGVVIALVAVIYKLFGSTIDLKIDLKIELLRKELGLVEIEHLRNDKKDLKNKKINQ